MKHFLLRCFKIKQKGCNKSLIGWILTSGPLAIAGPALGLGISASHWIFLCLYNVSLHLTGVLPRASGGTNTALNYGRVHALGDRPREWAILLVRAERRKSWTASKPPRETSEESSSHDSQGRFASPPMFLPTLILSLCFFLFHCFTFLRQNLTMLSRLDTILSFYIMYW